MNYEESTRQVIADQNLGLMVQTLDGGLSATEFTNTTQTELFNVYGRIAVMNLFIELTAAADANASTIQFNCTFTSPVIAKNPMGAACASIANKGAHTRIVHVGGAVATAAILTDSAGLTDVETAGKLHFVGGKTAAGANTVGSIGILCGGATQAGTITGTAYLYYVPMHKGAYAQAVSGV